MSPARVVCPVRIGPAFVGGGVVGALAPPATSCVAARGLTVKLVERSAFPDRSSATSV